MKKIRNTAVALAAAGALTLTAAPAMAQDAQGSANLSSQIGDALNATDAERDVFGSQKNLSSEDSDTSEFTEIWYATTLSAAAAVIGGVAYVVYPAVQDAASTFGFVLPDRAPLPFD